MGIHLAGFAEDIDLAGAEGNIAALADDLIETNGDRLVIPSLNQIIAIAGGLPSDTALESRLRINAPSLLNRTSYFVSPLNGQTDADAEPSDPARVDNLLAGPLVLRPGEELEALALADSTAAAFSWCLLWLTDGLAPVPSGDIFTTLATGTTTLTARAWTSANITFAERLPVGRYAVVGMRYEGASAIAARIIFRGDSGPSGGWRPGVIGQDTADGEIPSMFRKGGMGNWGEFSSLTPPVIQCLADIGDPVQRFWFDLIRVSDQA